MVRDKGYANTAKKQQKRGRTKFVRVPPNENVNLEACQDGNYTSSETEKFHLVA